MTYKRVSGSSSAYTVTSAKSIKGPGGIFISTGYEGFRFDDGSFVIQSGKLVEIGASPSPSPAPASGEHPLLTKLRAAGIDPDMLAAAMK